MAGREGVDQVCAGKTAEAASTVVGNGASARQRSVATGAAERASGGVMSPTAEPGWPARLRVMGEDAWEDV